MSIPAWEVELFVLEDSPFIVAVPARMLKPGLNWTPEKLPAPAPVYAPLTEKLPVPARTTKSFVWKLDVRAPSWTP